LSTAIVKVVVIGSFPLSLSPPSPKLNHITIYKKWCVNKKNVKQKWKKKHQWENCVKIYKGLNTKGNQQKKKH
jgi:hypothetical protein